MESIMEFISAFNGIIWKDYWTLYFLLCCGILFTIWTKFSQFKVLTHGVAVTRGLYDDPDDPGAINHFQALSAALSATIGLGNIGGVAVAVALGGPGAVFWMWVVGVLGMALKTVEITLTMMYRNTDDPHDPHGGAMWVIDRTLGAQGGWKKVLAKTLGVLFCITLLIMTIAGGNMFQTWNVADLSDTYFGIPEIVTGILLAVIVGMVIIGGIERIGRVAGRLVPVMCALYLLAALSVLAVHAADIPALLLLIVQSAFSGTEAAGAFVGGSMGFAFAQGMKRALFSNEAGLGSAPIAHAAAKTNEPAREGIVGGMGPFIDTICICTLTALVILSTGAWNRGPVGELQGGLAIAETNGSLTLQATTDVAGLPALPKGDEWTPSSKLFVLVDVPDDDGTPNRSRVYGTIETNQLGEASTILWDDIPANASLAMTSDGEAITGVFKDYVGASLTAHAFDLAFPGLGKWLVTIAAWLFAISTMISWSYYGEQGIIYMLGKRAVLPYKIAFLILAIVGAFLVNTSKELGDLQDFGTGGMLIANMLIVLTMGFLAVRCVDTYFQKLDAGEFPRHTSSSS